MTAAEQFIVGQLVQDNESGGSAAFRLCLGLGVTESAFDDERVRAVWRLAGEWEKAKGGAWEGWAFLLAVEEKKILPMADLLAAQDKAVSAELLPFYVRELLVEAWRRDMGAAAATLQSSLAGGSDGAKELANLFDLSVDGRTATRHRWQTAGQILDAELPSEEYFLAPWLGAGRLAALVGAPGTGKTRFVLWTLCAMLAGRERVGTLTIPFRAGGGKWLVVASGENRRRRWQADLEECLAAFPDAAAQIRERLVFHVHEEPGDKRADAEALPFIEAEVRSLGDCEGVVFDPLTDFLPDGADPNGDGDMKRLCLALAATVHRANPKAAVLLVHHARGGREQIARAVDAFEAGGAGRNSKMLAATCRCVLNLVPYDAEGGIVAAVGKCNDAKRPEPFAMFKTAKGYEEDASFSLATWLEEVRPGRGKGTPSSRPATWTAAALAALLSPGELVASGTWQARAEAAGMRRSKFYELVQSAVGARLVERVGRGLYQRTEDA